MNINKELLHQFGEKHPQLISTVAVAISSIISYSSLFSASFLIEPILGISIYEPIHGLHMLILVSGLTLVYMIFVMSFVYAVIMRFVFNLETDWPHFDWFE